MQFKIQNFQKQTFENTKICCVYKDLYNNKISGYAFWSINGCLLNLHIHAVRDTKRKLAK